MMGMASGSNLPLFINKMDGGKLELDQNISNDTLQIDHNLGDIPKGILLYRLTGDIESSSTQAGIIWALWIYNQTGSTGAWIKNSVVYASSNGAVASLGVQSNISSGIRNITSSKFDIYSASTRPLLANEDYYWIAWI